MLGVLVNSKRGDEDSWIASVNTGCLSSSQNKRVDSHTGWTSARDLGSIWGLILRGQWHPGVYLEEDGPAWWRIWKPRASRKQQKIKNVLFCLWKRIHLVGPRHPTLALLPGISHGWTILKWERREDKVLSLKRGKNSSYLWSTMRGQSKWVSLQWDGPVPIPMYFILLRTPTLREARGWRCRC